jgi:hypothetical protein
MEFKKLLEENKKVIHSIIKSKNPRNIISKASENIIHIICETVLNILYNNIDLDPSQLAKLYRYKEILRQIARFSNIKEKKKLIRKIQPVLPIILNEVCKAVQIGSGRN